MIKFSPITLQLLKESGWTEDRSISVEQYKQFFEETNQPYSDTVLDFLRSFGELKISFPLKSQTLEYYWFNVEDAALDDFVLERYTDLIGKPMCSIALSRSSNTLLMMMDGQVFEVFDSVVSKLGNSGEEAIEMICTQGPGLEGIPWVKKAD